MCVMFSPAASTTEGGSPMKRYPFLIAFLVMALTLGVALPRAGAQGTYTTPSTTTPSTTVTMKVGDPYTGPAIVISGTPDIVVIPGTSVSYIRNSDYDMYRVGNDWYYRYDGKWYKASNYNGPYTYVITTSVPRTVR